MSARHPFLLLLVSGFTLLWISARVVAQVSINTDGSLPDNSAILDVKSVTRGLLIPRMTLVQIEQISAPANGMLVFCTTNDKFYAYVASGNSWKEVAFGSGTVTPWSCGSPFIDFRDNKTYATVVIGAQCWMAQNLNAGIKLDGAAEQADNGIIEKYCYINNENYCNSYGGLYQWNEMMQYASAEGTAGICMAGWHLPTDAEMNSLVSFLNGDSVAGGKMKEAGLAHWAAPNTGATNSSGFTGLPAGRRNLDGSFSFLSAYQYLRSSTEFNATIAWVRNLSYIYKSADRSSDYSKSFGFSVRCVKD